MNRALECVETRAKRKCHATENKGSTDFSAYKWRVVSSLQRICSRQAFTNNTRLINMIVPFGHINTGINFFFEGKQKLIK